MTLREEYEILMNRAIYGTKENHPEINIGRQMQDGIRRYIEKKEKNDYQSAISGFCQNISRVSNSHGVNLRDPLQDFCEKENYNIALGLIDLLGNYCELNYENDKLSTEDQMALMRYYIKYLEILRDSSLDLETPVYLFRDEEIKLSDVKNLNDLLVPVMNIYYKNLKKEKVFDYQEIEIKYTTKTGKAFLSNINRIGDLRDSFSGFLLDGKITISSDVGYPEREIKEQQDAVASIIKDENCFLNVVADGVGSSSAGANASSYAIDKIKTWFDSLEDDFLRKLSPEELKVIIDHRLKKINDEILEKYRKNGFTTIVFALTIDDYTIIANVGDSTAYEYDESKDKLIELTTTDSVTQGMEYEQARNYPGSNQIYNALGAFRTTDQEFAHYRVIPNDGRRIILSSDGVTDLIHVERFKNYFKENTPADEIVEDAVYFPDKSRVGKTEDNASAIVIDLPKNQYELGRSR